MGHCNWDLNRVCGGLYLLVGALATGLLYGPDSAMTYSTTCCILTVQVFSNVKSKSSVLRAGNVYF